MEQTPAAASTALVPAETRATLGPIQNPVRGFLHGSAGIAALIGAGVLWGAGAGDPARQIALAIFAGSFVALYTVSSLYHSVAWSAIWKARMQRVDHSLIYVVIAGSYTPLAAIVLEGWLQAAALAAVWGIAAFGAFQKLLLPARLGDRGMLALQLTQGWLALLLIQPMLERLPSPAVALALLGGALYTAGAAAWATRRPRLWPRVFSYHEVFHVFVVAGSAVHFTMTLEYLARFSI